MSREGSTTRGNPLAILVVLETFAESRPAVWSLRILTFHRRGFPVDPGTQSWDAELDKDGDDVES